MALPGTANFAERILLPGLFESDPHVIQIRSLLGIKQIDGVDLRVLMRSHIPANTATDLAYFLGNGAVAAPFADGADIVETYQAGELFAQEELTITERDRYRFPNDLKKVVEQYARKRVDYLWYWGMFRSQGAITVGEFAGLPDLVNGSNPNSKRVDNGGGSLDLVKVDEALSELTTNSGRNAFIAVNQDGYRAFKAAMRAANMRQERVMVPIPDDRGKVVERSVLSYDGFPILIVSFIETIASAPDTTSAWVIDPAAVWGFTPSNGTAINTAQETDLDGTTTFRIAARFTVGLAIQQYGGVVELYDIAV